MTSVTSSLAAKCSRNQVSSTYVGKFFTHSREVAVGGWGWGAEANAEAGNPAFMVSYVIEVEALQLATLLSLTESVLSVNENNNGFVKVSRR